MRYFLLLLTLVSTISVGLGQSRYNIEFVIPELSDTTIIMGYYYGESTYVKDTSQSDEKGRFTFSGAKPLKQGVYFLVLNKNRLFDFPIGKNQEFTLKTKKPDFTENMKVKGDLENEIYFEDLKFNIKQNEEAKPYVETMRDSTASKAEKSKAREKLQLMNDEVMAHQNEIIEKYPDAILSKIHKANKRIKVPEAPEGTDKQDFKYSYYKNHYWDYFDLSDPVFLKLPSPVYKEKLNDYLDKLIYQHPDSIIMELDQIIAAAKPNEETYKYAVWSGVLKYQYPEIMGLDEVYVHLYDEYFETGEMDFWANDQLKKNLKDRADQLRMSLIGKKAPNLIMQDANFNRTELYDIEKKYTVIYFFDPDCGHCKKETPKLVDFYNTTNFDVEVFAVSADTSMHKMKKYIKDMDMNWITVNGPRTFTKPYHQLYDAATTPTIYVLDRKKEIIAKKLPAERLDEFLTRYEAILREN